MMDDVRLSDVHSGSFAFEMRKGRVYLRVKRQIPSAVEDRFAEELAGELHELMHRPWLGAVSLILDLRAAPSIAGSRMRDSLGGLVSGWERSGKRVAIVVGEEPIKQVQIRTVITKHAPTQGKVVTCMPEAEDWCGQVPERNADDWSPPENEAPFKRA